MRQALRKFKPSVQLQRSLLKNYVQHISPQRVYNSS
uniref:Uncharacterized protein n=1 Tax=Rhizophora mucronata TaxID=61149 RepID=A0A2P2K342_RHIMU